MCKQLPSDTAKKLPPPPTKAKPKPQETIKKPVLPPNTAAAASSNLANVLKEGKKVSNLFNNICLGHKMTPLQKA